MKFSIQFVFYAVYNTDRNINMFQYIQQVVSNGRQFLKVHRV